MMNNHFNAKQLSCTSNYTQSDEYFRFTFVREPTSRFISAYQETLSRLGWNKKGKPDLVPEKYHAFLAPYQNKTSVKQMSPAAYTKAFKTFVQDYDALYPFEGHMRLQTPRIIRPSDRGEIDEIMDTGEMDEFWSSLAKRVLSPMDEEPQEEEKEQPQQIKARHIYSRGSLMNMSMIDEGTKRQICQLTALDYCCLNYPLPRECSGAYSSDDGILLEQEPAVQCRWVRNPDVSDQLMIEDVSPFPPAALR